MIQLRPLRRLQWKLGRRMYMAARGEPRNNLPASSDERYLQYAVLRAARRNEKLIVLDVGANRGQWSSQLLHIASKELCDPDQLILHAFEPVPASQVIYQETLSTVKGGECAVLHPIALSNTNGNSDMAIWGDTAGTNTLSFDSVTVKHAKAVLRIRAETIDTFLSLYGIDHVRLIKIDTEGHDLLVLEGGRAALANESVDVIQFEYSHRWIYARRFLRDVFLLIQGTPYILARIRADRLERIADWHPELERYFDANFALVHPRAEDWFRINNGRFDESRTYA